MNKSIEQFNFANYANIDLSEELLSTVRFNASWLLPQAMAFLANSGLRLVRNAESQIDTKETISSWIKDCSEGKIQWNNKVLSLDWLKGLIRVLNRAPRGEILGSKMTQYKPEGSRWSAAVPLILSAFKEHRNVKYSEWDMNLEGLKYFVDRNMESLLFYYPYESPFSNEELLQIRDETNNGKPLHSRATIPACSNAEFNKLPRYMKTLLCQTWVWNPSVRHSLAITNLKDLDTPAEPLVNSEIFRNPEELEKPWNM